MKTKRRESSAAFWRALLSFILVLYCIAPIGVRADDAADIKTKLEAIRKAGEPTTGQELDKWYPEPPVGQNAAPAIMKAFAKMRLDGLSNAPTLPALGKGRLPEQGAALPPEVKTSVMTVVANNQEALESLHESLKGRQCRYPVDLKNGFFATLPHLAEVRHGVELLELGAVVADEEGQTAKAAVCMEEMLRLGASLKNEPILISQLVRIACDRMAGNTLEWVINRRPLPEEQLHSLALAFKEAEDPVAFPRGLIGERASGIIIFQMPPAERRAAMEKFVQQAGSELSLPQGAWAEENSDADFKCFLASLDEITASLAKGASAMHEIEARFLTTRDRRRILSALMLPEIFHAAVSEIDHVALMRTAQLAIAIERYRRAHSNQFPANLEALVPTYLKELPADPYRDGKFVVTRISAKTYVISSRANNGSKSIAFKIGR